MNIISRQPSEAQPNRLAALARLPIFLDLHDKPAVLAGCSAGAAWKAELLAAAGAHVHIYAEELSADMAHLLERGAAAGRLTHIARAWQSSDLQDAAIGIADCESEEEARAFQRACKAAGVICNTIDKRDTCDFEFGSIVNRSPVVISISTTGGAPILAQAIRRRIETLLAPSLADWAQWAKEIRKDVMARLSAGPQRRAFWERFADLALSSKAASKNERLLDDLIQQASHKAPSQGRVTLVGAGPGDAELLTLKAVRALQSADVILFDDLVSDDVLELARREAQRMMVGKRARSPSCAQDDINALMLKLAKQGKHVVRLKSGDPMIFGRAGEEIEDLRKADIPVEVVPGITTASAFAASLGLSLTHRDHAQSVRFVTGHARTGDLPSDLDWQGLAHATTSLVFYMAGRTGPLIARKLIDHGMTKDMPTIIGWSVSRVNQGHCEMTLDQLANSTGNPAKGSPVLLCIGSAFTNTETMKALQSLSLAS